MLDKPQIISTTQFSQKSLSYKWDLKCHERYTNLLFSNEPLFSSIKDLGYKATIGMAAAITEWIHWRVCETEEEIYKHMPQIEVIWFAAIDPLYISKYDFEWKFRNTEGMPTPLSGNWFINRLLLNDYMKGVCYVHRYLMNLLLLILHLLSTNDKKVFNKWFEETVQKIVAIHPCPYKYEELPGLKSTAKIIDLYDCSNDAPISRDLFFNSSFSYTEENNNMAVHTFLQSLDYTTNPFLSSPEEMIAKGFKGKPYRFK